MMKLGLIVRNGPWGPKGAWAPRPKEKKILGRLPKEKKMQFFLLVIFFFLSRVAFLSFKNLDPFLISLAQLVTTNHLTKRTKQKKILVRPALEY